MENLVALIPVINRQNFDWLKSHPGSRLWLLDKVFAVHLLPRLERLINSLPDLVVRDLLLACGVKNVSILHRKPLYLDSCIMPDEDISHLLVSERVVISPKITYESLWARYDMKVVIDKQPILANIETSSEPINDFRMQIARDLKKKSPDWFRQVGAVLFRGDQKIACAYNTHLPNEYEACIFGDPAINRDAGENLKISLALHAESALIALCARNGIQTKGLSLYVTTFPCPDCARMIAGAGISEVFFEEGYSLLGAQETFATYGVKIIRIV